MADRTRCRRFSKRSIKIPLGAQKGHFAPHKSPAMMLGMLRLPADVEIVVNRLGEPLGDDCRTILVVRTAAMEVEARWDTATRLYWLHAFALHRAGQRSHVVAVRSAPHVRGVLAVVAGLVRREKRVRPANRVAVRSVVGPPGEDRSAVKAGIKEGSWGQRRGGWSAAGRGRQRTCGLPTVGE